jgi:hypothetical protein
VQLIAAAARPSGKDGKCLFCDEYVGVGTKISSRRSYIQITMLMTAKILLLTADSLTFRQINTAVRAIHHILKGFRRECIISLLRRANLDRPVNQQRYQYVKN